MSNFHPYHTTLQKGREKLFHKYLFNYESTNLMLLNLCISKFKWVKKFPPHPRLVARSFSSPWRCFCAHEALNVRCRKKNLHLTFFPAEVNFLGEPDEFLILNIFFTKIKCMFIPQIPSNILYALECSFCKRIYHLKA